MSTAIRIDHGIGIPPDGERRRGRVVPSDAGEGDGETVWNMIRARNPNDPVVATFALARGPRATDMADRWMVQRNAAQRTKLSPILPRSPARPHANARRTHPDPASHCLSWCKLERAIPAGLVQQWAPRGQEVHAVAAENSTAAGSDNLRKTARLATTQPLPPQHEPVDMPSETDLNQRLPAERVSRSTTDRGERRRAAQGLEGVR